MVTGTIVVPGTFPLAPKTPKNQYVDQEMSYWFGYQGLSDMGSAGTSLAQGGIIDDIS